MCEIGCTLLQDLSNLFFYPSELIGLCRILNDTRFYIIVPLTTHLLRSVSVFSEDLTTFPLIYDPWVTKDPT